MLHADLAQLTSQLSTESADTRAQGDQVAVGLATFGLVPSETQGRNFVSGTEVKVSLAFCLEETILDGRSGFSSIRRLFASCGGATREGDIAMWWAVDRLFSLSLWRKHCVISLVPLVFRGILDVNRHTVFRLHTILSSGKTQDLMLILSLKLLDFCLSVT